MNMGRPRTLLGMVLMSLAFVTVPLLLAVGNGFIRLGQLAAESEVVLNDGATSSLHNERLANLLGSMERNARNYVTIKDVSPAAAANLLAVYDGDQADFEESVAEIRVLPSDTAIRDQLARLSSISRTCTGSSTAARPRAPSSSASVCCPRRRAPSQTACARRRTRGSRRCKKTHAPRSSSSRGCRPR